MPNVTFLQSSECDRFAILNQEALRAVRFPVPFEVLSVDLYFQVAYAKVYGTCDTKHHTTNSNCIKFSQRAHIHSFCGLGKQGKFVLSFNSGLHSTSCVLERYALATPSNGFALTGSRSLFRTSVIREARAVCGQKLVRHVYIDILVRLLSLVTSIRLLDLDLPLYKVLPAVLTKKTFQHIDLHHFLHHSVCSKPTIFE